MKYLSVVPLVLCCLAFVSIPITDTSPCTDCTIQSSGYPVECSTFEVTVFGDAPLKWMYKSSDYPPSVEGSGETPGSIENLYIDIPDNCAGYQLTLVLWCGDSPVSTKKRSWPIVAD